MRVALRNEFGGISRTVDVSTSDEGTLWEYAHDEPHRDAYPATRKSVQVAMADGSWCNGTIVED